MIDIWYNKKWRNNYYGFITFYIGKVNILITINHPREDLLDEVEFLAEERCSVLNDQLY